MESSQETSRAKGKRDANRKDRPLAGTFREPKKKKKTRNLKPKSKPRVEIDKNFCHVSLIVPIPHLCANLARVDIFGTNSCEIRVIGIGP
jgi:hypothetical protein